MKNDPLSLWPALVELDNVQYSKGKDLGIDFSNEIDAWSKMEFRYRHQMKELRRSGKMSKHEVMTDVNSLFYAVRQKIE